MREVFKLHACCFPVKGAFRSVIYDLQRKRYDFIPNALYDIITEFDGLPMEFVKKHFDDSKIVEEYFDFLIEKEYIFFCDEKEVELFPQIQKIFHYPGSITNAIIDVGEDSDYRIIEVLNQLSDLGCRHVQIRVFNERLFIFYKVLMGELQRSDFKCIEFIAKYNESFSEESIIKFVEKTKRIGMFVVHSAPYDKVVRDHTYGVQSVLYVTNPLEKSKRYKMTKDYFNLNMDLFMEAHFHNPYFNRKLAIDVDGAIQNCTSMDTNFGTIKDHKLKDIVVTQEFQKLWNVKKDDIEGCRDCEFRYMCVDNRVPVKTDQGWIHTEECAYDPYTATWKD